LQVNLLVTGKHEQHTATSNACNVCTEQMYHCSR